MVAIIYMLTSRGVRFEYSQVRLKHRLWGALLKKIIVFAFALSFGLGSACAASGLFTKMPAAAKAFLIDSRKDGQDAKIIGLCLAGMLNQPAAEVYMQTRDHDREQLDQSKKPYEVVPSAIATDSTAGLRTLFGKYQSRVKKMFIYDPAKDWSFYLAMMASAQQEGMPVTASIRDSLKAKFGWAGAEEDFRTKWAGRIPAYDYALQNLMPNCTRKSVFVIKYNWSIPLFDYAIASKGFIFWLDFNDPAETAEIEKILTQGKYAVGASLMGYANVEDHANKVANKFGIGYVASDYYANGSFWSSFPNKTYAQGTHAPITAEKNKVYVCFLWSDGDNIQFDQNGLWSMWHDPARGTVPVGTPLNPGLQELNPSLMDYFYNNKTPNDELISGPCGFQFIYTVFFASAMLPGWLDINRKWLADAGFHAGSLWWTTYPTPEYDNYTKTCGLDGLFHNYGQPFTKPLFQNGVALFNEYIKERRGADTVYSDLAGVAANPAEPQFRAMKVITPFFLPNGYAQLKAVADSLNRNFPGKYVFLTPTAFINTAKQYYGQPFTVIPPPVTGVGATPKRPAQRVVAAQAIGLPRAYYGAPGIGVSLRDASGRLAPIAPARKP